MLIEEVLKHYGTKSAAATAIRKARQIWNNYGPLMVPQYHALMYQDESDGQLKYDLQAYLDHPEWAETKAQRKGREERQNGSSTNTDSANSDPDNRNGSGT